VLVGLNMRCADPLHAVHHL